MGEYSRSTCLLCRTCSESSEVPWFVCTVAFIKLLKQRQADSFAPLCHAFWHLWVPALGFFNLIFKRFFFFKRQMRAYIRIYKLLKWRDLKSLSAPVGFFWLTFREQVLPYTQRSHSVHARRPESARARRRARTRTYQ